MATCMRDDSIISIIDAIIIIFRINYIRILVYFYIFSLLYFIFILM
jgi:hypothetical protein